MTYDEFITKWFHSGRGGINSMRDDLTKLVWDKTVSKALRKEKAAIRKDSAQLKIPFPGDGV